MQDNQGKSALTHAIENKKDGCAALLRAAHTKDPKKPKKHPEEGKDPAPDDAPDDAQGPEPRPELGLPLVEAAKKDDAERVVSLLGQGAPVDFRVRGSGGS